MISQIKDPWKWICNFLSTSLEFNPSSSVIVKDIWWIIMSTDLAPAYSPFFGCMGAASAIVFACKYLSLFHFNLLYHYVISIVSFLWSYYMQLYSHPNFDSGYNYCLHSKSIVFMLIWLHIKTFFNFHLFSIWCSLWDCQIWNGNCCNGSYETRSHYEIYNTSCYGRSDNHGCPCHWTMELK